MSTDAEVSEIELPDAISNVKEDSQTPENQNKISDGISVKSLKSFVIETITSSPSEETKHKLNQSGEYNRESKEAPIEPEINNEKLGDSDSSIHSQPEFVYKDDNQLEEKVKEITALSVTGGELEMTNSDALKKMLFIQKIRTLLENISLGYIILFEEEMEIECWDEHVLEHFYIEENKRALKDDDVEKIYDFSKKYESLRETLNEVATKERILKNKIKKQEKKLNFQLKNLKSEIETNEILLKKKFFRVGMRTKNSRTREKLSRKDVDRLLMKMSMYRNQTSIMRIDAYKIRTKKMNLLMKIEMLDDLGNGLRLTDFEKLKYATNNLQESVEEELEELDILRFRSNKHIYLLAHIKQKLCFNKIQVKIEEEELKDLEQEKLFLRRRRIDLNRKKRYLRKKIRQKKAKSFKRNMPLIRYYNKITEEVEDLRNSINQYENDINEIANERVDVQSELTDAILKRSDSKILDKKLQEDLSNMDQTVQQPWIKRGIIPVIR